MKTETIKVLLIDDDEDDYILTRELLSEVKVGKYALDWAPSYEEGLGVIARGDHDVCLVDYHLGEHTGVQLIREARQSGLTTPMILLTGQGNHEVDVEAMEAGAIGYLVKDETPTARLERTIRYAVQLNTEHSRAEEAIGAYAQKHSVVAEIGRLALIGTELKELFAEAVTLVERTLGVEYCEVLELLPDGDALILRAGVGWKEEYPVGQATVSAAKESQAGFTLLSDEPVIVEDLRTETRFSGPPLLHDHGVVSGMTVIIRGRERAYGILGAHTASARGFTTDDVNFLRSVANVLAEAIGRKQAEEALRIEREYFGHIISAAPTVIVGITPEGATNFVNQAIRQVAGYEPEELMGRDWWRVFYPGEEYRQVEQLFKDFEQSGVVNYEMTLTSKGGEKRCVSWNSVNRLNEHGELVEIIGIGNDVTDRKRAVADLALFRQLMDQSNDGIFVINASTSELSDVNETACRQFGYARAELLRLRVIDINTELATIAAWEEHRQTLESVGSMVLVFNGRRKDCSTFPIEISLRYVSLNDQHYVLAVTRDITERARLLSELKSERTRLVDIFTHAPAFIASLLGPDHIFEIANTCFYDLVGGQRDIIGMSACDAFPELEGQGFFELLDNVYATGVPFVGTEMPVEFADGAGVPRELRYINFIYQPQADAEGTVSSIICHGVDVTEQVLSRRRLEETENQLRQSQKLESVGMLAGGIAHDFNNLLTVITGYSDLTLRRLHKADPLARNVEEIAKAAEGAASLTRQLLAFSRKQVLQPKVLDLNSVIANIERMLGRLVGEDMELRTSPGVGLGQVQADPGQIEQVIVNLVVNARDAMPKGGKITIETANIYLDEEYARRHIAVQPGWYAMLAVTDTGYGMDAETQRQIFEPFFTTKEQGKGTGLGLSTVYGIVKQSGGNIWVYSEVGVGTTFKIYLPAVDEQATEPDAAAVRPESVAGTETILLAEDEEMVRNLARESLKMHGYTVLEAANAGEALSICQQHEGPIHLLLTDVVMPRMSGRELAEQLAGLRPGVRVLYMSGYPDQSIVHHGLLDGDIAFIGKPFTPDALVLKVVEVLQQNVSSSQSLERINSSTPDGSNDKRISYRMNEMDEIVSVSKR